MVLQSIKMGARFRLRAGRNGQVNDHAANLASEVEHDHDGRAIEARTARIELGAHVQDRHDGPAQVDHVF